jgi:hypothetical protein
VVGDLADEPEAVTGLVWPRLCPGGGAAGVLPAWRAAGDMAVAAGRAGVADLEDQSRGVAPPWPRAASPRRPPGRNRAPASRRPRLLARRYLLGWGRWQDNETLGFAPT